MAILFGTPNSEVIDGTNATDIILANDGNDLVKADAGDDLVIGGDGNDTLSGGDGNDTLIGEAGDDVIVGDRGNDTMIGGSGSDRLIWNNGDGSDAIFGNEGIDTVEVNGSLTAGDSFTLGKNGTQAIFDRVNLVPFKLTVESSEQFEINGKGGDDTLAVGDLSGTDVTLVTFSGGDGNDTLDGSSSSTQLIGYGDAGNDELIGSSVADILYGGDGDDHIEGEKGNDTMIGGAGNDTLGWDDGDGSDRISGDDGYDTVEVDGSVAKGDQFELKKSGTQAIFDRVNLGPFTLTVDTAEQFDVSGEGGDDSFKVGDLSGTDVQVVKFSGGDGNDTLDGSGSSTQLIGYGDAGNDELIGSSVADILYGGDGDDHIEGEKGNDTMIGGAGNDTLGWDDGDGSDRISGDDGYDTVEVDGSVAKGDQFELKKSGTQAIFDRVNLGPFTLTVDTAEQFDVSGEGGDDSFKVGDLSGTDVQVVKFSGGDGNDTLDGSGSSTQLIGYGDAGNDELIGSSVADILYGGDGDDEIEGEKGNDTMIGGAGNDTLGWDDGDGSDLISGDDGYDTVEVDGSVAKGDQFELKKSGTQAIFDRVNLGPFTLTVDTAEQFDVSGEGGDDSFKVGDLSGTDVQVVKFSGGDGNDTLDGRNSSTQLIGSGDAGDDVLLGGHANDVLSGGKGADFLVGGLGNDTLTGGAGRDVFGFATPDLSVDTITDFSTADDLIVVSASGFGAGLVANSFLTVAQFRIGAAAQDASDRFIYNGNTGALYFDADGTGGSAQVQIASLSAGLALTNKQIFAVT